MSVEKNPDTSPKAAPAQRPKAPRPPGKPSTILKEGITPPQRARAPRPPGKPSTILKKGIG